jgi:hypothetical protein
MLTLKRFKKMTDSYGADLLRWPERERAAAQTLLEGSAEARALLADARMLDEALAVASTRQIAAHRRNNHEDAALARLRSGVAARIAAASGRSRVSLLERALSITIRAALPTPLGWAGLATAGSLAVVAGLVVGSMYTPPGAADVLLTLLQPAPIDNLGGLM